jgi:hypothetical protein
LGGFISVVETCSCGAHAQVLYCLLPDLLYCLLFCLYCPPGCATVAEVRKRGDEFWKEFEFYLSDMLVGE